VVTGASSASSFHASTSISLPWLTSPEAARLRTTSGPTSKIEVGRGLHACPPARL
jgi:hypothetical protein